MVTVDFHVTFYELPKTADSDKNLLYCSTEEKKVIHIEWPESE